MDSFAFYPIRTLTLLKEYEVLAHFKNGEVKLYDFRKIINELEPLKPLAEDYQLFTQIHLSAGGYSVVWNDDMDLASEELWYDGVGTLSPFCDLMAFRDAEETWGLKPSALRKAVQYKRFTVGLDVMHFGKQWVVTRQAMEREYGPMPGTVEEPATKQMKKRNNIDFDKYPKQGEFLGKVVAVCFNYNTEDPSPLGRIIRDDIEEPYETVIQLTDGRVVRACECQYRVL